MSDEENNDTENTSSPGDDGQEGPDEKMDQEALQKEMAKMLSSVKDLMLYNLSVLASQAWHHLGLVPIPGTEGAELDIEQAKLAIDLYEANLKVLEPHMDPEQAKELKRALMDLHLNYVNKAEKK
ncbi:MAG: DUF1844 domain-containing protein [Candidatus Thermoplasmatota archaeon]|nr:DUF1844 domain-containing protein [Candidatus Thermoplasmatota archaeon]